MSYMMPIKNCDCLNHHKQNSDNICVWESYDNNRNKMGYDDHVTKLYKENKDAIVSFIVQYNKMGLAFFTGSGSGFFIEYKNNLYVITSAHVVLKTTVIDPM